MSLTTVFVESPVGRFALVGDERGLWRVHLPHEYARASRGPVPTALSDAANQLTAYLAGELEDFDVVLAPVEASEFHQDVWRALRTIPYGQVRTYAEVAAMVGRPLAYRGVGNANHHNPWPVIVPCHRVVAANALGGYGGGEELKRYLLEREGVSLARLVAH